MTPLSPSARCRARQGAPASWSCSRPTWYSPSVTGPFPSLDGRHPASGPNAFMTCRPAIALQFIGALGGYSVTLDDHDAHLSGVC